MGPGYTFLAPFFSPGSKVQGSEVQGSGFQPADYTDLKKITLSFIFDLSFSGLIRQGRKIM
jgi:hypothetical protein